MRATEGEEDTDGDGVARSMLSEVVESEELAAPPSHVLPTAKGEYFLGLGGWGPSVEQGGLVGKGGLGDGVAGVAGVNKGGCCVEAGLGSGLDEVCGCCWCGVVGAVLGEEASGGGVPGVMSAKAAKRLVP